MSTRNAIAPLILSAVSAALISAPVQAASIQCASNQSGSSIPTVTLWSGYGVNLSFLGTGQVVKKAWLDDPSRVTLDTDSSLEKGGAEIIRLRQIKPLNFPKLIGNRKGTLLSLVTEGGQGKKACDFRIVYSSGTPQYSTLIVQSSSSQPTEKKSTVTPQQVRSGMSVAQAKGLLVQNGPLWQRLQLFLSLYQRGTPAAQAAQQAGVPLAVVEKLGQWGVSQPTQTTFL